MTVEDVHGRIRRLAADNNLSIYELARKAGISESTLYNIFERGTMPKIDTLDRICTAVDITMSDFFIFGSRPGQGSHITEEETELLEISRELTKRNREHLMIYAQGMIASQQSKKKDIKNK